MSLSGSTARIWLRQREVYVLDHLGSKRGAIENGNPLKTSSRGFLAAVALALTVSFAGAAGTDAERSACTPDVFRLCSSDIPNVQRIVACLQRERTKLSPACRATFDPPATRALNVSDGWCVFGQESAPNQQLWRTWCDSAK
jgi:hypothetical protein